MKKRNIVIVTIALILLFVIGLAFYKDTPVVTSGYFTFSFKDDQAILINVDKEITGQVVIPAVHEGYPVTQIANYALYGCENITDIFIPDSITVLPHSRLFDNATGIWVAEGNPAFSSDEKGVLFNKDKTVLLKAPYTLVGTYAIPITVTQIGEEAFYKCVGLTDVIIQDGVAQLGDDAFGKCVGLTNVVIPDSVTEIGPRAFCQCENLERVTMGSGVRTIGMTAFSACSKLSEIALPDGLERIGSGAFQFCESLVTISIPDRVTEIGDFAFRYCYNLENIDLGVGINTINEETFSDCRALAHLTIPDSVTKIEQGAFSRSGLVSIVIPNTVTFMGSCFYNCDKLECITVGSKVAQDNSFAYLYCDTIRSLTIADGADKIDCNLLDMLGCRKTLTEVVIPDSVTCIGINAFFDCDQLSEIVIPNSVNRIENYAFNGCKSLNVIRYEGTMDAWNDLYLGMNWNSEVPAKEVICSNGRASLK